MGADAVEPAAASAFALPDRLAAKADPVRVARDEEHLAAVSRRVEEVVDELSARLDAELRAVRRVGQEAMDRDEEVERLSARLRTLRRFGRDLCLGRMVAADGGDPVYVGRLGLTDRDGGRLLVDWRSPAAEPFFAATHADPMGLASRRRYRWTDGRITDYWDELLVPDALRSADVALDDQSAFIASLGTRRSARMRDVLATIAADQDTIVRAGSRGALVVDGGPGTGKTVVALHRAAHLLYSDPRLARSRGGVLVVGPHRPYLAYVADVLPSLGEDGVAMCTLRDLVPEGAAALPEPDPRVAGLKARAGMVRAVAAAVRFYEESPASALTVETDWSDVRVDPDDWAAAFESREPGVPHNEARDQVWDELLDILVDKHGPDVPVEPVRRALSRDDDLRTAFGRSWPLLEAADVVGDLWRVPAYLRLCAPWLSPEEVQLLQRDDPAAWTVADLPLLDAARHLLGDPEDSGRRRRQEAVEAAERARMDLVVDELLQADEDGMLAQLRQDGIRDALVDEAALPAADHDRLAGPFAHIVVDEAQELTDAEWQMIRARCPSGSLTVVGDRAQARHGFTESWQTRLDRVGVDRVVVAGLSVNYRTPAEVMRVAEPVIRAAVPDANVPTSIRSGGGPVVRAAASELPRIVEGWLAEHGEGTACVVGQPAYEPRSPQVRALSPELVKGLEFDLVVLVDPDAFGDGIEGAVDRYVAMTRATEQLVLLTTA